MVKHTENRMTKLSFKFSTYLISKYFKNMFFNLFSDLKILYLVNLGPVFVFQKDLDFDLGFIKIITDLDLS